MVSVSRAEARAPVSLLAAEYVHTLPSLAFLMVALSAWVGRSDGTVRTVGLAVVLTVLVLRLVGPIYGWWTVTYVVDDAGVSTTRGLLARRTRTVAWSRVKSVETTRPWYLRLFGLNRVTLIQAGEESAQVVLQAVSDDDPVLSRLRAVGATESESRPAEAPSGARAVGDTDVDSSERVRWTTIHALDARGLIFVSLAYGQAFLLAPAVLMTGWEALGTLGLTEGASGTAERFGVVPVVVAAALGALLVGIVGTVVRFHGFRVSTTQDGRLAIRYGLIEARERIVDPEAVVGVVVQRNVLERAMGRARLSVVTRDASGGIGTSVIVPSVSLAVVDSLVQRHLSRFPTDRTYRTDGRGSVVRTSVSALALVVVPVLVFGVVQLALGPPVVWSAVAALVSLALLRAAGVLVTAGLHFEAVSGLVVHTTLFSFERITTVVASSLHGVAAWHRPGRRAGLPMFVTCHLYTGRARRLSAPRCDRQELDALRAAMTDQIDRIDVSTGTRAT